MSDGPNIERGRWFAGALPVVAAAALAAPLAWRRIPRSEMAWAHPRWDPPPGIYFLYSDGWIQDPWEQVAVVDASGNQMIRETTRWERFVWCVENPRRWWLLR